MGSRVCAEALALRIRHTAYAPVRYAPIAVRPALCTHILRPAHVTGLGLHAPVHRLHTTPLRCEEQRPEGKEVKPADEAKKSPTIRERISNMWSTIKYLFRFYLNGVKQIWRNRELVKEVKKDLAATGRDMTYEEGILIRTHASDMYKLPLFLLILVTVEELLPLMVIYTPFLLPSTCILPSQRLKIRKRFEVQREACIKELRAMIAAQPQLEPPYDEQLAGKTLSLLPPEGVKKLINVYNLSSWGGTTLMRSRLVQHMKRLREDDVRLATSSLLNEPKEESIELLADACTERGVRAVNVNLDEMVQNLRRWLESTQVEVQVPDLELALTPARILELGASETDLVEEIKKDEEQSVAEQTNTVVKEVVEQEKRNEGEKKP